MCYYEQRKENAHHTTYRLHSCSLKHAANSSLWYVHFLHIFLFILYLPSILRYLSMVASTVGTQPTLAAIKPHSHETLNIKLEVCEFYFESRSATTSLLQYCEQSQQVVGFPVIVKAMNDAVLFDRNHSSNTPI